MDLFSVFGFGKKKPRKRAKKQHPKKHYTLVEVVQANTGKVHDDIGGTFKSTSPIGAARKMYTRICRAKNIRGQCTFHLLMQEVTPGHTSHKMFAYTGKRVKRKVPKVRTLPDGRTITNAYDMKVTKRV